MAEDLDELDAELAAAGIDVDDGDLDPMDDMLGEDLDDELDDELDDDLADGLALDDGDDDSDDDGELPASGDESLDELDDGDGDDEDAATVARPEVLSSTILEEEFDDVVAARPVRDDEDEDDELRDGEFVCRSCFMAKRETAMADEERMLCNDCV